ncbi:hypothetical protein H5410_020908 [Solanum commersonii]|uniref:Isopentenyltransferase n=1 Tax=Solanum commersonii TaxID=4109 RepID=A0A9J5Z9E5_SOLCO|nr:hypothetical protein H5410_020908 [Solanum commersonii]
MRKCAKMNTFINNNKFNKKKVVFIMGATGTGKSRLTVDLATHFRGERINSDKMKVYKGLEIVINKITHTENFIGEIEPYFDFTAEDFCLQAIAYIEIILKTQRLVNEMRQIFNLDAHYTKGIRRFIGVPVKYRYLREETNIDEDDESKKRILQSSIVNIRCNTRLLICYQLDKIQRLINEKILLVHHIISTDVSKGDRKEVVDEAWRNTVLQPCVDTI